MMVAAHVPFLEGMHRAGGEEGVAATPGVTRVDVLLE